MKKTDLQKIDQALRLKKVLVVKFGANLKNREVLETTLARINALAIFVRALNIKNGMPGEPLKPITLEDAVSLYLQRSTKY